MLEFYWTKNQNVHRKIEILIERKIGKNFKIERTLNGKPYIKGNPLYFSLSHSRNRAVIALSDKPVGIDCEYYEKRNFSHILSRLTQKERLWIGDSFVFFFMNWITKEAYIKLTGGTLAQDLKRLEYYDYKLYVDGAKASCGYTVIGGMNNGIIFSVCSEGYGPDKICDAEMKLFKLKKDEKL